MSALSIVVLLVALLVLTTDAVTVGGRPEHKLRYELGTSANASITDAAIFTEEFIESIVLDTGHTINGTRLRSIGTYAAIVWPDSDSETKDHRP